MTVPAGASRRYRVVTRQLMVASSNAQIFSGLSTSNSTLNGNAIWELGGLPHVYLPAGWWNTSTSEGSILLAPGTYTYYYVYSSNQNATIQVANESTSNRLYCNIMFIPY